MTKLIVISNRLPVSITRTENSEDSFIYKQSSGGLVTGLISLSKTMKFLWVGNLEDNYTEKEKERIKKDLKPKNLHPVFISKELNNKSYNGFCNEILWPNLHFFCDRNTFNPDLEKSYEEFNNIFYKELENLMEDGDLVWVHDYHFFLLPYLIRKETLKKNIKIGFFLHTCFTDYDVIKNFPYLKKIVKGLVCADHVGVHTFEYKKAIQDCIMKVKFSESEKKIISKRLNESEKHLGEVKNGIMEPKEEYYNLLGRKFSIKTIPIGINLNIFTSQLETKEAKDKVIEIKEKFKGKFVVLGVDRIDYIKGIPNRLKALEKIHSDPKYKKLSENMIFIQIGVPSREKVKEYKNLTEIINLKVSEITSKTESILDHKIYYLNDSVEFSELCALYRASDACLVTSIRDGMNLVCMEYVACQGKEGTGVTILSEFAGASSTLPGSVGVSPYCVTEIADKIKIVHEMSEEEKKKRSEINFENVSKFDAELWASRNKEMIEK